MSNDNHRTCSIYFLYSSRNIFEIKYIGQTTTSLQKRLSSHIKVSKRLKSFLKDLFTENINTDNVILIVTHQTLCTKMLNIANKGMRRNKKHIELRYLESYDKGKLCLIYDNNWTFHLLN